MAMALIVPQYTVADLDRFPDDGNRYELLDGMLLVTPAPRAVHQVVATRLAGQLYAPLVVPGYAHVVGPGAVTRLPSTQLQPDVLVYPARFAPTVDWVKISEHWLGVEVLSRSSRVYDRDFKRDAYFALGVHQVWLVDIGERTVEQWLSPTLHHTERESVRWAVPTLDIEVDVNLTELFAGVD